MTATLLRKTQAAATLPVPALFLLSCLQPVQRYVLQPPPDSWNTYCSIQAGAEIVLNRIIDEEAPGDVRSLLESESETY